MNQFNIQLYFFYNINNNYTLLLASSLSWIRVVMYGNLQSSNWSLYLCVCVCDWFINSFLFSLFVVLPKINLLTNTKTITMNIYLMTKLAKIGLMKSFLTFFVNVYSI